MTASSKRIAPSNDGSAQPAAHHGHQDVAQRPPPVAAHADAEGQGPHGGVRERRDVGAQQRLGLRQQLARERHDEAGAVADLLLRGLGGRDEQVRGRVLDLELADDRRGVGRHEELVEVVDDDLFHP